MRRENQDASLAKIVLAANLYYKKKYSQQKISEILQISRPWVSKLLARAEELGIVEIRVKSSVNENTELSDRLRRRFGLDYAGVIREDDSGIDHAAVAAANYFLSCLHDNVTVGIGWGKSVSRVMDNMPDIRVEGLKAVPLAGSFGDSVETLPNFNALHIASRTGGESVLLHVPAFCASAEEYETIRTSNGCSEVIEMAEAADVALLGAGSLEDSFLMRSGVLNRKQREEMRGVGIVGDVSLNFFDANGERVFNDLTRRIICADIHKLRRQAESVIIFAEGEQKVETIRAILRGGLATALITNESTAAALLED